MIGVQQGDNMAGTSVIGKSNNNIMTESAKEQHPGFQRGPPP